LECFELSVRQFARFHALGPAGRAAHSQHDRRPFVFMVRELRLMPVSPSDVEAQR
jgi:hypothetical protein